MKKNLILIMLVLTLPIVFAGSCNNDMTIITGKVFSGYSDDSPVIPGVQVDVTCNQNMGNIMTNNNGEYMISFVDNTCPLGSTVTACIEDKCTNDIVTDCFMDQFNLLNVNIYVPEFTTIAAGLALIGAGVVVLRKKR